MTEKIDKSLETLLEGLGKMAPELVQIMDRVKSGELSEEDAMIEMMAYMQANPDTAQDFEALANTLTAPLRELPATQSSDLTAEDFQTQGIPIWEDRSEEGKLSRFNPLYEAAVTERLQFDGDIPELRTGPMPEGAEPAVPVDTNARNPVALGAMLKQASEEVAEEIKALLPEYQEQIEKLIEAKGTALTKSTPLPPMPQPKGYGAGMLPALKKVAKPSGSQLAKISQEERHELAWKALSTTQGRRSIVPVIKSAIEDAVVVAGFPLKSQEDLSEGDVLAHHEWSIDVSGPNAGQPDFSFIDVATKALSDSLIQQLSRLDEEQRLDGVSTLTLDLIPINTVNVRRVGWAARITVGKP